MQRKSVMLILNIIVSFFLSLYFCHTSNTSTLVSQETHGDQSPAIKTGGDVNITYGIPQKVVDRLLKNLEEKDIEIQEREAQLKKLTKKYNELESQLAKRAPEDTLAAQAKEKLSVGDIEGAESSGSPISRPLSSTKILPCTKKMNFFSCYHF